jgi:hypothetical protein
MTLISWFADLQLTDRPAVGGKGGSLGELTRAGISVPPGFVVRVEAFDEFLANVEKTRASVWQRWMRMTWRHCSVPRRMRRVLCFRIPCRRR